MTAPPQGGLATYDRLKRLTAILFAVLLIVIGANMYKYRSLVLTSPESDATPQTEPEPVTTANQAQSEVIARPEPEGWSAVEPSSQPTDYLITFREGFIVELSGSVPSWEEALLRETSLRNLLDDRYQLENNLAWNPRARSQTDVNYRSIEIETETLFESGQTALNQESEAILLSAQIIQDEPDLILEIIGHTDSDGDTRSNRQLGLGRGNSVAITVIELGVPRGNIIVWSAGEARPKYNNDSPEKSRNRRIELNFLPRPNSDLDQRLSE